MKLKTCSFCGKETVLWKSSPKSCKNCWQKHKPNAVKKAVNTEQITENNNYYRKAIASNIIKNGGKCLCDECGERILQPDGKNCCHIVGSGANKALYLDDTNHFILGKGEIYGECNCGWKFDESGYKHEMKIYPEYVKRREELNLKYYKNL